jgi:hypothetical protein
MWTTLAASGTLESAYAALLEIYDADPERLGRTCDFVGQLAEAGLVDVRTSPLGPSAQWRRPSAACWRSP